MHLAAALGGVGVTFPVAIQSVAGYSQTMLLGLLAILVLPAVTILFVGNLVSNQTIDEERVQRLESEVAQLREELGTNEETRGAE